MAKEQRVYNLPNIGGVTSGWKSLAQVVGVGPDVNAIFNSFMNTYRSTITGSSYNYIGVGTATDDNDILWVVMIFMNGPDGLVDDPPDETTTTTSTTKPPTNTTKPPSTTSTTSTTAPPSNETPPTTASPGGGGSIVTEPTTTIPTAPPTTQAAVGVTTTTSGGEAALAAFLDDPPPDDGAQPGDSELSAIPTIDEPGGINPTLVIGAFTALACWGSPGSHCRRETQLRLPPPLPHRPWPSPSTHATRVAWCTTRASFRSVPAVAQRRHRARTI